ncbi:hypothetical protein C8D92_102176 [Tamilnaduibacter salinus]|uniref:ATPase n=1 Tax=Tamilnaduibacter salinus TaxID=1484056 RepID=A0A2U1CZB9_9GAMM|nr:ATPase [Tamilnaduibacter salinus]PVY78140.1 hypothetical protein C8D92_102176 [Tamilnaduibacter salinus]
MDIKTFGELIDWTRDLHQNLATCLRHCAAHHDDDRAKALLTYLASHENELSRIVDEFEHQSAKNTLSTRIYDYLKHQTVHSHESCDPHYAQLNFDAIYQQVMEFHDQIMTLFQNLSERAEIPEARDLLESLLTMETNEAKRLASQVGRMDDL